MTADDRGQITRAVLYAAKSTADKHGSIPTQLADCRAAATAEGREVVATFQDEGFSAYSGDRGPGLTSAMLAAAECQGELWVQHSDRLARGGGAAPGDAMHLAERWFDARRAGFRLRSVQDDRSLHDLVLVAVMGDRNHEDSKRKSNAVRSGLRRRAEKGLEHGGGAPAYGYERVGGELRPLPHEAGIVRRIYAEYVAGARQQVIARQLNGPDYPASPPLVPTKRGKGWTQPAIHGILANPIYVGKLRVGGDVLPGAHEPIIDARLWGDAQALLRTLTGDRGRPADGFLLSGRLLRCTCGATMVPRSKGDGRYLCHERHRDPTRCGMPTLPRSMVDDAVIRYFTEQLLDRAESRRRAEAVAGEQVALVREQREQAERAEAQAAAAVARVERDYLSGDLPAKRYDDLVIVAEAEHVAAHEQAERLRDQERVLAETPDLPDVLEDLQARLLAPVRSAETTAALRSALRRVFSHFELATSPAPTIPVGLGPVADATPAADDPAPVADSEPSPVANAAPAAAAGVGERLGVTVPDDGPFWREQRFYLVPVLLPDVDLGVSVEPWLVVESVALFGSNKSAAARAKV